MKTVYKYEISYKEGSEAIFLIPRGAKFLSLQVQYGNPVLYFEVEPTSRPTEQKFLLVETGATVPLGVKYIGTVMLAEESYVLHIYWYRNMGIVM